jgi:flagellar biogenesis protein FliO
MRYFKLSLILSILILTTMLYGKSMNFSTGNGFVAINFNQIPDRYNIVYYDYGLNIFANGVSYENMEISKFQNNIIVKLIPLNPNKSLIKIQYPVKNLKEHVKINTNGNFTIKIYKDKIITSSPKKESQPVLEKKSIVDIASKDLGGISNNSFVESPKEVNSEKSKPAPKKDDVVIPFDNKNEKKESSFFKNVVRTYSVLFLLCIMIIGGGLFLKKFYKRISPQLSSDIVKIIYKKNILPKKSIAIAKILNNYYILGITNSSISTIDKIVSDEIAEELKILEGDNEKEKFINYLKKQDEDKNIDKDKMIKLIQHKLREYRKNSNAS